MRIFLLDKSFSGESLYKLRAREIQYLYKVLRLEEGQTLTAKSYDGVFYKAVLMDGSYLRLEKTDSPEDTLLDHLSGYQGPFVPLTFFISLLKGKKNEIVVRMLTECGVRKIVFVDTQFVQEHTLPSHMKERLETIAKEAVQQSGSDAVSIEGPVSFDQALSMMEGTALILHQSKRNKTESITEALSSYQGGSLSVFIGPEGGFSDEECEKAENRQVQTVLLNTNILRAETAAIYTVSAIQTILHV